MGFVKSLVAEKDVRLAVTWATEYFTSDGTFATPTQIEEEGNFKSCHMTVADVKSFDPEVLKDPFFEINITKISNLIGPVNFLKKFSK